MRMEVVLLGILYARRYCSNQESENQKIHQAKKLVAQFEPKTSHILPVCNLTPPTSGGNISAELLPSSIISIA